MKKFIRFATALVLSVGLIGSVASAADPVTCEDVTIHNSGDNNNTNVVCENVETVEILCVNNVIVGNVNVQVAESGEGTVDGNESSGSVNTGTAVNYNGTETTIGASCELAASPSPSVSPSPSPSPEAPGKGAVTPTAAELPETSTNDVPAILMASVAAAAAVVGLSRAGLAVYRRSIK